MNKYQVLIIGGGPGGYVCAIRLAQLGFKVALIDKNKNLGGICLNEGCIPSKALLSSSEHYHNALHSFEQHGISMEGIKLDIQKMMKSKEQVVQESTSGISFLMKKNKIKVYTGLAKFKDSTTIELIQNPNEDNSNSNKTEITESIFITAEKIIIATGSLPIEIPSLTFSNPNIISSTEALSLKEIPKRLTVIGAGAIGLELGSVWSRLGSEVNIVEALPALLLNVDKSAGSLLQRSLSSQGIKFHLATKAKELTIQNNVLNLSIEKSDGSIENILSDKILVAVGRGPNSKSLNLNDIGIDLEASGHIKVNATFQTNIENIYAIGDITKGPMLAHRAQEDGVALAEILAGHKPDLSYNNILPFIVYTNPEVAWAGKSEAKLKEENIPYKTGRFFFRANGRAKAMGLSDGQIKILAHKESDEILGLVMLGPYVSELIAEAVLAMKNKLTVNAIAETLHAHPTLSEAFREAAMACNKKSIHG